MNIKTVFAITIVVVFLGIAFFLFYRKVNNSGDVSLNPTVSVTPLPTSPSADSGSSSSASIIPPENNKIIKMENGLQIQDLKVGTGSEAKAGDTISVNYVG